MKTYQTRRICYNCDQVVLIALPFGAEFYPYDREARSSNITSAYLKISKDGMKSEREQVFCDNCGLPRLT